MVGVSSVLFLVPALNQEAVPLLLGGTTTQTGIPEFTWVPVQCPGLGRLVSVQVSSIGPFRIHLFPSASVMRCLIFAVCQMPAMLSACIELLGPAWELLSQGSCGLR